MAGKQQPAPRAHLAFLFLPCRLARQGVAHSSEQGLRAFPVPAHSLAASAQRLPPAAALGGWPPGSSRPRPRPAALWPVQQHLTPFPGHLPGRSLEETFIVSDFQ